jgi:hypothetical protein
MERWQEPQMHEKERALTPVEAFGIVLAEAKRRGLPWHHARKLAIKALPWSPESGTRAPANDAVFVALMDWYEAIMWALPAFRAAYLGTTAPRLSDEDTDEFDPAAFSAFVAATEHESVEVPAGEWAPPGLDLD